MAQTPTDMWKVNSVLFGGGMEGGAGEDDGALRPLCPETLPRVSFDSAHRERGISDRGQTARIQLTVRHLKLHKKLDISLRHRARSTFTPFIRVTSGRCARRLCCRRLRLCHM